MNTDSGAKLAHQRLGGLEYETKVKNVTKAPCAKTERAKPEYDLGVTRPDCVDPAC